MIDDPDQTPPPRRPSMVAFEPLAPTLDAQKTKFSVELKAALIIAGALLTAGFGAGTALFRVVSRIDSVEKAVALNASRADLQDLKREIRGEVRRSLKSGVKRILVRCPRTVAKGTADVECQAVLLPEADDE